VTAVDSLILKLDVCDMVSVGNTEELKVADDVGDKEMDVESDRLADDVRDMEGESEAVALIEGVEAAVAEREMLWLWLNVEDSDPDTVAIEDMVMEALEDEEGVLLGDVEDETLEELVDDIVLL